MERDEKNKQIDQKYIDMVARFNAIPNDRKHSVERIKKIIFGFEPWYRKHCNELTKEEREYLQSNIYRVDKEDEYEEQKPPKDPWDE